MKRVRFSLLSLLVGVVLAGGVVWLNLQWSPIRSAWPPRGWALDSSGKIPAPNVFYAPDAYYMRSSGWPFVACVEDIEVCDSWSVDEQKWPDLDTRTSWQWPGLAANIAIGLAIVFGGAGACEWLVRRRAAKAKE